MILKNRIQRLLNFQNVALIVFSTISFITLLFILFHNLGNNAIADWDEARHGINAYEMLRSNNWIISTYQYEPDLWNLKPPFSYYLIALFYQLFGFSAFSLRIYSVISLILVFIISIFLLYRFSNKISIIVFDVTFLSFAEFFIGHCGRTGDADALFLLLYLISMTGLVISKTHHWGLYIFGIGFSLAFLTKSFHAAPIMLIGIAYIILSKLYKQLKLKDYIITFITSTLPIVIWAVVRYINDGMAFLGIMFGVDVTDRMATGASKGGSYFGFIKVLLTNRPTQVIIAMILLCYIIQFIVKRTIKIGISNFQLLLYVWFFVTLIFFSLTRTIEFWYYIPTFLCLILLVSITINDTILLIKQQGVKSHILISVSSFCLIALFTAFSFLGIYRNIKSTFEIRETMAQNAIVNFTKQNPTFEGYDCYFVKSKSEDPYPLENIKEGVWEQCDVLCAELNGDYKCLNGGIEGFRNNKKSILFIEKSLFENHQNELSQYEVYEYINYKILIN